MDLLGAPRGTVKFAYDGAGREGARRVPGEGLTSDEYIDSALLCEDYAPTSAARSPGRAGLSLRMDKDARRDADAKEGASPWARFSAGEIP